MKPKAIENATLRDNTSASFTTRPRILRSYYIIPSSMGRGSFLNE